MSYGRGGEEGTDRNGDKPEGGVADDDVDGVQDAEQEEHERFSGVEAGDTRARTPAPSLVVVVDVLLASRSGALLEAEEGVGADGAAEGVDGGEGVWERKVDEDRLVVESEGETEEEVEREPERRRGRVEGECHAVCPDSVPF